MATNSSSNQWLWFIARRCVIYLLIGGLVGALWGAICIGSAGGIVGTVVGLSNKNFQGLPMNVFGTKFTTNIAVFGTIIGLYFGAMTGGVIGLLSWAVVGIIAPPSPNLLPPKQLIRSMLGAMGMATAFGLMCYFVWPAVIGPFRYGFIEALQDGIFLAMFGIPALMGIGQIAGVWRAVTKLRVPPTNF